MSTVSNLLWRPKATYNSASEWAQATHNEASLKSLKPPTDRIADCEWLLQLAGGKVIGDARLVASREDAVIGQLQSLLGIENPAAHWTVSQKRVRWTIQMPGISFLLGVGAGGNYYHWLFEALPRLDYLRRSGLAIEDIDHFVINQAALPFNLQTLDLLRIPSSKRLHCSKRRVLECETLLVPPMPLARSDKVAPWVCQFLRRTFLPACPAKERGARLYLSRRDALKRRLADEPAMEKLFSEHGFTIVRPETLSFQDQVSMFAGASLVAGPHGAAFANLVFAPADTRVIELFHPEHQTRVYKDLATELGMSYECIVGTAPFERAGAMSEKLGPYTVELDQVKQLLMKMT